MTDNPKSLIQRKIRKLQQLEALLDDPDISDVVRTILTAPQPAPIAESQAPLTFSKARRRYKRSGGSLLDNTFDSLREFGEPTNAAELAEFMRSRGFKFQARKPKIAVSKALRLLADTGKIQSRRGDHKKSPITYWVNIKEPGFEQTTTFHEIPVQETTTH